MMHDDHDLWEQVANLRVTLRYVGNDAIDEVWHELIGGNPAPRSLADYFPYNAEVELDTSLAADAGNQFHTAGMYFVYAYAMKDTGKVFYIGYGRYDRVKNIYNRSESFRDVYATHPCKVYLVGARMRKCIAQTAETACIQLAQVLGCPLVNDSKMLSDQQVETIRAYNAMNDTDCENGFLSDYLDLLHEAEPYVQAFRDVLADAVKNSV